VKKIPLFTLLAVSLFIGAGGVFSQTANNLPVVQTGTASLINTNYATLNGQINPNGFQAIFYFEYGSTMSLGNVTPSQSTGVGYANTNVSSLVSGLSPGNTYYYRIDAVNSYGTSQGAIVSFTTLDLNQNPSNIVSVTTNAATDINGTNVTLHAYAGVSANQGLGWFEYGTDYSNLNMRTPATVIEDLNYYRSNNQSPFFSYQLTNLNPNTVYYFRAALQNGGNISYGQPLQFLTGNSPSNYINYSGNYNQNQTVITPTYNNVPATNYVYTAPKIVYVNPDGTPYVPQTQSNIPGNGATYQQGNNFYAPYYGTPYGIPSSQVDGLSASALGTSQGFTSSALFGAILFVAIIVLIAVGFSRGAF
jgi:hypothetical protein